MASDSQSRQGVIERHGVPLTTSHSLHNPLLGPNNKKKPSSRRNSTRRRRRSSIMLLSPTSEKGSGSILGAEDSRKRIHDSFDVDDDEHEHELLSDGQDQGDEIAIASTGKSVAPFLARHIPNTYNPMGAQQATLQAAADIASASNTKYCNRHRPDRKCRRQADGPSMEQLQNELSSLSNSDRTAISHVWSVFSAAPGRQRELILQGILSVACFNQLSFISAQVRDLIKIDFISLLPTEISLQILSKLDTISLCKSAQVSRRWRQLADDDVVWHRLCEQHLGSRCRKCGWGLPILERKRLRQEKRQIQLRAQGADVEESLPETKIPRDDGHPGALSPGQKRPRDEELIDACSSPKKQCTQSEPRSQPTTLARRPWKDVYKTRFKVGSNWKHGRHNLQIIKGHTNGITCMQAGENSIGDNVVATGSYDTTIKMWDVETGKHLRQFDGHTMGVRAIYMAGNQLISGGLDGSIKLWDIMTGKLMKELSGPTKGVLSIHLAKEYLAAGSMDKMIYIWNKDTRRTTVLRGHTDFVNSVFVDQPSRTLFSASDDCTIALWDLDTKRPIMKYEGHVGPVQCVIPMPPEFELDETDLADIQQEFDTDTEGNWDRTPPPVNLNNIPLFPHDTDRPNPTPQYILSAGLDATVRLWHVSSGRCLRTFFGHLEGIWALAADNLRIVSTSEDGMVKVWCPSKGVCERTYTGHAGPVTCCSLSGERLISGGEDCEIRIMTFSEDVGAPPSSTSTIAL